MGGARASTFKWEQGHDEKNQLQKITFLLDKVFFWKTFDTFPISKCGDWKNKLVALSVVFDW